jgi:hypothetical protein
VPKGRLPAGEFNKRVKLAKALLAAGYTIGDAYDLLSQQFKVAERAAKDYVAHARELMLAEVELTPKEYKAQSYMFYSKYSHDIKASVTDRLRARAQLDKLVGAIMHHATPVIQQAFIQQPVEVQGQLPGAPVQQIQLPTGQVVPLAEYKAQKVKELTGQFAAMVIDKAKAYDMELPEELQELDNAIESAKNVTPTADKKRAVKKGKRK